MSHLLRHLLVGIGAAVLAWLLGVTPIGRLAALKLYDVFLSASSPHRAPPDVVIVAIDEPSFAELGLQWPWPRRVHAQLVRSLAAEGAAVIAYDVVFAEPSNAEDDQLFAEAIRDAGNIVLAADRARVDDPRFTGEMLIEPIDVLAAHASTGLVDIPLDRDFVVRRHPALDLEHPGFAAAVAARTGRAAHALPAGARIAFRGPAGTFTTVSCYQALDAMHLLPPGFFAEKIVLIGRTLSASPEPGARTPDLFATPFLFAHGGTLMSGVEIHANLAAGFLDGRAIIPVAPPLTVVLALLVGCAGSLLHLRWQPWRNGLLALAFATLVVAISATLFAQAGLWLAPLPAAIAALAPYGWFALDAYFVSERKRREIRRAFGHYLSPAILEDVLRDPNSLQLGGRQAVVTVMFTDLAGFTAISEHKSPEEVIRFLNRYFTEMTRIVFAHRGTVDKFVGDALMAFWGAPVADPDHALNACQAALAMQERLDSLRAEMRGEGLPELHMRIGINSGEAIVGNMGSTELFGYTALGDTVNLASRLESANKEFHTSILISQTVVTAAGPTIRTRPLGPLTVRGRSDAVEVYELSEVADAT